MTEFLTNERPEFSAVSNPQGTPDLSWQERALCAQTDPEAFFPEKDPLVRPSESASLVM